MDEQHPWLRAAAALVPAVPEEAAPTVLPPPPAFARPQFGVPVPDRADRLPQRSTPYTATVWWLGVSGGSGESTLAALAKGSRPADHSWPIPETPGTVNRVVLVARTNFVSLTAAQRAATEWASGVLGSGIQLGGLALIPDAPGRLPKELRDLARVVGGGVPRTWSLPWVDAWRFGPVNRVDVDQGFSLMFNELHLPSAPH